MECYIPSEMSYPRLFIDKFLKKVDSPYHQKDQKNSAQGNFFLVCVIYQIDLHKNNKIPINIELPIFTNKHVARALFYVVRDIEEIHHYQLC